MKYLIWINSEGKPNVAKNESSNITIIINIILLIENVEKNVIIVFNCHYRFEFQFEWKQVGIIELWISKSGKVRFNKGITTKNLSK